MGYAKPELLTMCIRCCNKSDRAGLASWLEDIQHHLPPSLPLLFIGFQTLQSRRLIITYECYPKAQVSNTRPVGQIRPTRPLHVALTPLLQLRHPLASPHLVSADGIREEDRTPMPDPALLCAVKERLIFAILLPISGVGSREQDRTSYRSCASLCSCGTPWSQQTLAVDSSPPPDSALSASQQKHKVRWVHYGVKEGGGADDI